MPFNQGFGLGYSQGQPPTTHFTEVYGAPHTFIISAAATLTGTTALTTNQGYIVNPFPYARIRDIAVQFTASGTGTFAVDLYNTLANGTQAANSWFTIYKGTPFSLPASTSAPTGTTPNFYSAQFSQGGATLGSVSQPTYSPGFWRWENYSGNPFILSQGAILSLRAAVATSGQTLTGLICYITLVPADYEFIGQSGG